MGAVNNIESVDGNQYLVNGTNTVEQSSGTEFDQIFNSNTSNNLEDIFNKVSAEYDVPVNLLKAVAQAESAFDTNAVSHCGAAGIMQLMPETAKSLGVEDVFDAEQNITGGAKMLAYLLNDYNGDVTLALAAYNAGSGNVAKYGGVPPFAETQNYIKKIYNILSENQNVDTSDISIEKDGSAYDLWNMYTNNTANSTDNTTSTTQKTKQDSSADTNAASAISNSLVNSTDTTLNDSLIDSLKKIILGTDANGNTMTLSESISYENYMDLLDSFQDILATMFGFSNEDKDTTSETSNLQNLYELQSSMYNAKAMSLIKSE